MAQLGDALVEGEHAADREQHDGDDEGPEVALPPVAEGVLGIRLARRPLAAEHQQTLVAGVGEGVDRLGEEARRAGDQETDELGDGDPEVGEERGEDRLLAAFSHQATLETRCGDACDGPCLRGVMVACSRTRRSAKCRDFVPNWAACGPNRDLGGLRSGFRPFGRPDRGMDRRPPTRSAFAYRLASSAVRSQAPVTAAASYVACRNSSTVASGSAAVRTARYGRMNSPSAAS